MAQLRVDERCLSANDDNLQNDIRGRPAQPAAGHSRRGVPGGFGGPRRPSPNSSCADPGAELLPVGGVRRERDRPPVHEHIDEHQTMLYLMQTRGGTSMRTTITIDDELLARATQLAGPMDRTAMVSEGLKALIERESARRLARLGGTQPALKAAPRRRQERSA
jgi:Arc/MetJ family transcription regulator